MAFVSANALQAGWTVRPVIPPRMAIPAFDIADGPPRPTIEAAPAFVIEDTRPATPRRPMTVAILVDGAWRALQSDALFERVAP